jgi:hypothetical protein
MLDKLITIGILQVLLLNVVRNASKERQLSSGSVVLAPWADGHKLEPGQVEIS